MAKKGPKGTRAKKSKQSTKSVPAPRPADRPSSLLDTRVIHCGLRRAPSSRDRVLGRDEREGAFEEGHATTQAYFHYARLRCVKAARVLKETANFSYP